MAILRNLVCFSVLCWMQASVAEPLCTDQPEIRWLPRGTLETLLKEQGYHIDALATTDRSCYQFIGKTPEKIPVQIFFNPTNGLVVELKKKSEVPLPFASNGLTSPG